MRLWAGSSLVQEINSLLPGQHQAITGTNADHVLSRSKQLTLTQNTSTYFKENKHEYVICKF